MVLALVAALVVPMAALAANPTTGTTLVSGQIACTYTITPPGAINLGIFTAAGNYAETGKSISVSTNDPSMTYCGIKVKDAKTSTTGYLTLGGADDVNLKLTNALKVAGGAIGAPPDYYAELTTEQTLKAANTSIGSANITDFAVSQTIVSGDLTKTTGTYSLTMTFTATFS